MSTIAVDTTTTSLPARVRVAAVLALPLAVMTCIGTVIFWDWSWLTWVGVWGGANGVASLVGAVKVLTRNADGIAWLRAAAISGSVYTVMKLVFWQEPEAAAFGVVSLVILALLRGEGREG